MSTFSSLQQFIDTITERFNKPRRSATNEGLDKDTLLHSLLDVGIFVDESTSALQVGKFNMFSVATKAAADAHVLVDTSFQIIFITADETQGNVKATYLFNGSTLGEILIL